MPIRTLPQALVNQIAAGEVVERPASVVKELLENALDAGALRIEVRIEGGGRERIEIVDDGAGIAEGDLALAFAPHATSKITSAADLESLASFGFRGEALSAIGAVADCTIESRAVGAAQGWSIRCRFGALEERRPASVGIGTRVEVRGLFANVPARRRFLRGDSAESARVTDAVVNAAMAHPHVAFVLESQGRRGVDLAPAEGRLDRILEWYGESLGERALVIDTTATLDDGSRIRVSGAACRPEVMRGQSRTQRLFVNGRPIVDRSLQHAVKEAYRGLAEPGVQPRFVIFLEVDPSVVDVNVHPQKSEVRWRDAQAMHRIVYRAVQSAIAGGDLGASGGSLLERSRSTPSRVAEVVRSTWPPARPSTEQPQRLTREHAATACEASAVEEECCVDAAVEAPLLESSPAAPSFLQVDRTWIVFAEGEDLVIVDQHALHERVMFEEIRTRILKGDLMSQRLLVPAHCPVAPESIARLEDLAGLFARLGIEVRESGPRALAVSAFPAFLLRRGVDPAEFVGDVLANDAIAAAVASSSEGAAREAALAQVLDTMACKAAVKGGDRLSPEEIARLLRAREATGRATNCPHGRPTSVRIALADIERRFGRR